MGAILENEGLGGFVVTTTAIDDIVEAF